MERAKMERTHFAGPFEAERAYSPMVRTVGGAHLWLAGTTGLRDGAGKLLDGDFEAQVRQCFRNMEEKLALGGGTLADLVTMTVFINDVRRGPRFLELRKEILKKDFPASALITVTGFADPRILIEIQSVAVVDR
jgi:enamine deaminase RidA (YjgF/YER057c/UK114 family)